VSSASDEGLSPMTCQMTWGLRSSPGSQSARVGPPDAAADIENPAALRKCNPLSLIAGRRQTARMQMLDGRKGFQE
jgi:hypothetical protein